MPDIGGPFQSLARAETFLISASGVVTVGYLEAQKRPTKGRIQCQQIDVSSYAAKHLARQTPVFERRTPRGAFTDSIEMMLSASKRQRPMHKHRPFRVLTQSFRDFRTSDGFSRESLPMSEGGT